MLRISDTQMQVLEDVARTRFIEHLAVALPNEQPQRAAELGADGIRAWIRHGIERAASYGITGDAAVARYVRLIFIFGREFDEDPRLPWVRTHLTDPNADQDARMTALTAACHTFVVKLTAARTG